MTGKEKLKKALEALKYISDPNRTCHAGQYAAQVLAELTQPRMETITGWINIYPDGIVGSQVLPTKYDADGYASKNRIDCIEITYSRPIPEPEEEEREGLVTKAECGGRVNGLPVSWVGSRVKVRRVEG